jgi:hypothetical protein
MMLSHEHGHNRQYQILGFLRYFLGIGYPSIFNANLPLEDRPFTHYYAQPWEIHADFLAGLLGQRKDPDGTLQHSAKALLLGLAYFAHLESLRGWDFFNFVRNDLYAFRNHDFSLIKDGG